LTPAQDASARLTSLIGTDEFIRSIIDRSGLTDAVNSGLVSLDQVRGSISVSPSSANTLRVSGSSLDPQVAFAVAKATVDSFKQWVIDASLSDSATAEQFLTSLAETYRADRDAKKTALDQYTKANPEPLVGTRTQDKQFEIDRLSNDYLEANKRYTDTLAKAEDARLASAQTRSNVEGRLRLVDAPKVPTASSFSKVKLILQLALFVMVGVLLTAVVVFVGTITDKSLRSADEIRRRFGVPLLALVPESRGSPAVRQRMDPVVDAGSKKGRRRRAKPSKSEYPRHLEDLHADL
jgi:capsular polysaccharide biosynthesis protein